MTAKLTATGLIAPNETQCHLCGDAAPLMDGHVIPAFVYRWLKETSVGYLRMSDAPNLRVQDGWSRRLLCSGCEQRFSGWEKSFADGIFHPLTRSEPVPYGYGDWLLRFAVSVSWRCLHVLLMDGRLSHFDAPLLDDFEEAAETWRAFLNGDRPEIGRFEHHVLPLGLIESGDVSGLPPATNRYFTRAVDLSVYGDGNKAFVYVKLPHFLIFGFIETPRRKQWKGTKVRSRGGILGPKFGMPGVVEAYFVKKVQQYIAVLNSISPRQQDVIKSTIMENLDAVAESGSFEAMTRDVEMFGRDAFLTRQGPPSSPGTE